MGISDYSIDDLFQFNASNAGTQPAIISPEKTLPHQQFLDPVDQPSAGLVESGIEKGDRICILAQNSIEYVELLGACAKTGAVAYPINWRLRENNLSIIFFHHEVCTGFVCSAIFTIAEDQVNPAPNETKARVSPILARPSSNASHNAIGIEAAEVFPYFWMLINTFSGGSFAKRAALSMIRTLAW